MPAIAAAGKALFALRPPLVRLGASGRGNPPGAPFGRMDGLASPTANPANCRWRPMFRPAAFTLIVGVLLLPAAAAGATPPAESPVSVMPEADGVPPIGKAPAPHIPRWRCQKASPLRSRAARRDPRLLCRHKRCLVCVQLPW
jgi:hypothetical protein